MTFEEYLDGLLKAVWRQAVFYTLVCLIYVAIDRKLAEEDKDGKNV